MNSRNVLFVVLPLSTNNETNTTATAGTFHNPTGARLRVLDAISDRTPRRVERVAELSGLALDRVRAELGLLELEGFILERPSGWMRRKAD